MLETWGYPAGNIPQEITQALGETGMERQRNPTQRVPLHKDCQNNPTPQKLSANPPRGVDSPRV